MALHTTRRVVYDRMPDRVGGQPVVTPPVSYAPDPYRCDTPLIVVATSYSDAVTRLSATGVKFRPGRDLFVDSTADGSYQRLTGMDMHASQVWIVDGWRVGMWWRDVERTLIARLARSGERLEDCHYIR